MLYFLLRYVFRYRLRVIRQNIDWAYPHLPRTEQEKIVRGFYHYLSEIVVEALLLNIVSPTYMKKHLRYRNIEMAEELIKSGKNIAVVFGHYNNWDWLSATPIHTDLFKVLTLYKQVKNKTIDKLLNYARSRFGTVCIEKNNAFRSILKWQKSDEHFVIAYNADQSPRLRDIHYWVPFMGINTPVISGWVTISRKLHHAIIYLDMERVSKHNYEITCTLLTDDAATLSEEEILKLYYNHLEQTIAKDPSRWLWSHRRWKKCKNLPKTR